MLAVLSAGALLGQVPGPSAAEYLGLSPDQVTLFTLNAAEQIAFGKKSDARYRTVVEEIGEELERKPQDPLAIGQRYAELETLRRESWERRATMIARHRALLNPSQADRLQALVEAKRLSRFGSEVGCLYLNEGFYEEGFLFCHRAEELRNASALAPAGEAPGRRTEGPAIALQEFLRLTPEQVVRYRANMNLFEEWVKDESDSRWRAAQGEACQTLERSPLEPLRIGEAIVAIDRVSGQYWERLRGLIQANQALLTSEQMARLRTLTEARELARLLRDAEGEGFFERAGYPIRLSFGIEWSSRDEVDFGRRIVWPNCPNLIWP